MFKFIFHKDNLMGMGFILLVIWLFSFIPLKGDLIDPMSEALSDFQPTDMVFSKIRAYKDEDGSGNKISNEGQLDTNLILVNIGKQNRFQIADQIKIVSACNPKVIGIDARFGADFGDMDSIFANRLAATPNLILVYRALYKPETDAMDSLDGINPKFLGLCDFSYANLLTDAGEANVKTCRSFVPKQMVVGKEDTAFAVKVLSRVNPEAVTKFLARNNNVEVVNFNGNMDKYQWLDLEYFSFADSADQAMKMEALASVLKGKIVLMGYLGPEIDPFRYVTDLEDVFYTPMNEKYAGKAFPDMYGLLIHANIISMIQNDKYINVMPLYLDMIIGLVVLFMMVVIFSWIYKKHGPWYGFATKVIQLVFSLIMVTATLYIHLMYNYEMKLSFAFLFVILAGDLLDIYYDLAVNVRLALARRKNVKQNISI